MKATFLFCPARDRFALLLQQFNNEVDETTSILRQLKPAVDKSASIHRQINSAKPFRVLFTILLSFILFSSCTAKKGIISDSPESETGMKDQSRSTDSVMSAGSLPIQISNRLLNFTELYPQEKLYIHTDKSHYLPGETIWFKAYLTDASSHLSSLYSRIVYIELVDSTGNNTERRFIEIKEGAGHGDFILDTSITPGSYVLRGHTNYMRNFTGQPLFSKELIIWDPRTLHVDNGSIDPDFLPEQNSGLSTGGISCNTGDFHINFFPEGGDLVYGLDGIVAVKASGKAGESIQAEGRVFDDKGNFVAGFITGHFGMSRFEFVPVAGQSYHAEVLHGSKTRSFPLPDVKEQGYTLHVNNSLPQSAVVSIKTNIPGGLSGSILAGHMRGKLFSLEELKEGSHEIIRIEKNGFPPGIVHLTLFCPEGNPVAERLLFINDESNDAVLDITAGEDYFRNRERVEIELNLSDSDGNPLDGDFSVSVTDSYVVPSYHRYHNIETYLLLSSDLPGYIENPGYFFDRSNSDRHWLLDLVMMTHGWRRFRWDELLADKFPEIKYPAGGGHILTGRVTIKDRPSIPVRSRVMLSAVGDVFFAESKITDDTGIFYFENLDFYDTTILILQGDIHHERRAARRERRGIDDSFAAGKNNWVSFEISEPEMIFDNFDVPATIPAFDVLSEYLEDSRKDPRLTWLEDIWTLEIEEVEIRKQRPVQRTTFDRAFYGSPSRLRDRIIPDSLPFTKTRTDVFDLIRSSSPGVKTSDNWIQIGYGATLVFFNGVQVDHHEDIKKIPIHGIAFIDILRPPQTNMFGAGRVMGEVTGVVSVFTKTVEDYRDAPFNPIGIVSFEFPGYYQAREFYSPKYDIPDMNQEQNDYRTTLFWEPEVKPGDDGKATISFYTSDKASVYRIVMEGITETGVPVVKTKEFWVQ
jgi:hypothetical protein